MTSDGYLTYNFRLSPAPYRGRDVKVVFDENKYSMDDFESTLDSLDGDIYRELNKMLYKISKHRIAENFIDSMNASEREDPPKMTSAPGFGHIHTDYWKVTRREKYMREDGLILSFDLHNDQPDFQYGIVVPWESRGTKSKIGMMNAWGGYLSSPTATGTVIYTGIVGNLAARKLTSREGDPMIHHGLSESSLGIMFENMSSDGDTFWVDGGSRTAEKFVYWDGWDWVFRNKLNIHGSERYRNAITHNIKQAVIDEIGHVKNGLPVDVVMFT